MKRAFFYENFRGHRRARGAAPPEEETNARMKSVPATVPDQEAGIPAQARSASAMTWYLAGSRPSALALYQAGDSQL